MISKQPNIVVLILMHRYTSDGRNGRLTKFLPNDSSGQVYFEISNINNQIFFRQSSKCAVHIPQLIHIIVRVVSIIDLRETVIENADYEITKEDLILWEARNKKQLESLVILWTGWASNWPSKLKYLGTNSNDISLLHFPGKFISLTISLI